MVTVTQKAIEDFKEALSGTFKSMFADIKLEGAGMSDILALGVAKNFASGGVVRSSSAPMALFDRGEFILRRDPTIMGIDMASTNDQTGISILTNSSTRLVVGQQIRITGASSKMNGKYVVVSECGGIKKKLPRRPKGFRRHIRRMKAKWN